jgi:acyl-CoA reductase-like NAD-dependent aldehyde dehydrogenase
MLPAGFPLHVLDGLPVGEATVAVAERSAIRFPFDGSVVAEAPLGDVKLAATALDEAVAVAPEVARLPSHVRRAVLGDLHCALADRRQDLEDLLVLETGKPLVDCRTEVARTLVTVETAAEEVARLHGETVPLDLMPAGEGLLGFWVRRPIGVVVGIAGFNYPLLLASHKVAPAFAAGCPVIAKPAPATPLATLWLVDLFRTALATHGLPLAAVQLLTGDAEVGATLTTDERVGAVSFTGSAAIGHRIARDAAPKRTLLELGSNSALVVCEDADLDAAADAVIRGGFYASGQACISVQRVIAVGSAYEPLLAKVAARLPEVVTGDPRSAATRVSTLINPAATERVVAWIDEACAAGARVVAGGGIATPEESVPGMPVPTVLAPTVLAPTVLAPTVLAPTVLAPTVLADVPDGCAAWDEEIFGPVVVIRRVADTATAFATVNRSRYGLHASVFTTSLATAFAAVDELEVGGVVVNEVPGFRADNMPYGGVKDSGVGREGPRFAIEELTVSRMAIIRPS